MSVFGQRPVVDGTRRAGADLSGSQHRFVKLAASGTVALCAAATDIPYGVLENKPRSGEVAEVTVVGKTKVSADAALSLGALIGTSADAQADAKTPGTDTTNYVVGQVTGPTTAAGGLAEATINCAAPARAA